MGMIVKGAGIFFFMNVLALTPVAPGVLRPRPAADCLLGMRVRIQQRACLSLVSVVCLLGRVL